MTEEAKLAGRRFWHVNRGTSYETIGSAELQMSSDCLVDGSEMLVYRGEDGRMWVRQIDEFFDGRFEETPAPRNSYEAKLADLDPDLVERFAPILDEIFGHPVSYSLTREILVAVTPIIEARAREEGAKAMQGVAPALDQLRNHQQQADMDGTFVTVSRQALDEVLNAIAALDPSAMKEV